jgi:hypothetical protein
MTVIVRDRSWIGLPLGCSAWLKHFGCFGHLWVACRTSDVLRADLNLCSVV